MNKRKLWIFGLMALFMAIGLAGGRRVAEAAENVPKLLGRDKILYLDGKDQISVRGKYILSVKYTSSKRKVATVSSKGVIVPKGKGKTKIRATVVYRKKASGKKHTESISYSLKVLGKAKEYIKYKEEVFSKNQYYVTGLTEKGKKQKELYIPDYVNGKVIKYVWGAALYGHPVMESLYLADGIEFIGGIDRCKNLKKMHLGKNFMLSTISLRECPSINKIDVDSRNKWFFVEDGVLFYQDENDTELIIYPRGKKDSKYRIPDYVNKIGEYSFEYCQNLKNITISPHVWWLEEGCFARSGLVSVQIPDNVSIWEQGVFSECISLKEITLSERFSAIPSTAFNGCTSLQSITLPAGIKSVNYDPDYNSDEAYLLSLAFVGCTSLTEIKVSDASEDFSSIDGVLYSKDKKTLVYYPEGRKEENYTVYPDTTEIRYWAFAQSEYLQRLVLPVGLQKIGYCAFYRSGIMEIDIPASVNSIEWGAFYNCKKLERAKLPGHFAEMTSSIFWECNALTEINLLG